MKRRRIARELCLQSLYLADTTTIPYQEILNIIKNSVEEDSSVIQFYEKIYLAAVSNLKKIDDTIIITARNWDIKRMLPVDRNIIRMAVCEMQLLHTAPVAVIIDEAIEIAKKFSTQESGKFVNGVLDSIAKSTKT